MSNGSPSYGFWALATSAFTVVGTITPRIDAPGSNRPSNFMPNQLPNSVESASARHTRFRGACSRIFFSMRSAFLRQPPGCRLTGSKNKCNHQVARDLQGNPVTILLPRERRPRMDAEILAGGKRSNGASHTHPRPNRRLLLTDTLQSDGVLRHCQLGAPSAATVLWSRL